jgi:hypothetical protein
MRLTLPAIGIVVLASCTERESAEAKALGAARTSAKAAGTVGVASGVSGTVTTLATYPGGAAHPGVNAVDIAAAGGAAVFHQLEHLPGDVAGGWVRIHGTHEPGDCSQWGPGSSYDNGSKLVVVTYFYGTDRTYRGWQRSAYQHVVPAVADRWITWNNASAPTYAWRSADVSLGAGRANGLRLGSVFAVARPITNGPGGGVCTSGSHLHQEADGERSSALFVGKVLAARDDGVHLFGIAGGLPAIGSPPSPPTFDGDGDP